MLSLHMVKGLESIVGNFSLPPLQPPGHRQRPATGDPYAGGRFPVSRSSPTWVASGDVAAGLVAVYCTARDWTLIDLLDVCRMSGTLVARRGWLVTGRSWAARNSTYVSMIDFIVRILCTAGRRCSVCSRSDLSMGSRDGIWLGEQWFRFRPSLLLSLRPEEEDEMEECTVVLDHGTEHTEGPVLHTS